MAWVNTSAAPGAAADAHESLRTVLAYARASFVDSACVHLPVIRAQVGDDGLIADPSVRAALTQVLAKLASTACGRDIVA